MRPREMLLDIDYSGLHSEPGSREWILTQRSLLVACLSDIKNNRATGQTVYEDIKRTGGWQHLEDLKGNRFRSFRQFCKSPNGLGLEPDEIERRLTAQELAASEEVEPLGPAVHAGPGRGHKTDRKPDRLTTGSAREIVARLKRDAPEFAERLAAGEFKSARACAIAAGIIQETPALTKLRRAWKHATPDERETFLAEIEP
jgi:hypothetical protein